MFTLNINLGHIIIGLIISIFGYLIKREISQFDVRLENNSKAFVTLSEKIYANQEKMSDRFDIRFQSHEKEDDRRFEMTQTSFAKVVADLAMVIGETGLRIHKRSSDKND